MDSVSDWYTVLGILPEAEEVVVTAAYRALAQRYHPDRWRVDPTEAHRRMAELNAAYSVLSDRQLREEYNRTYRKSQAATFEQRSPTEEAFAAAMESLEARWAIAQSIYPDIAELRSRLGMFSTSLAFAYVTLLLSEKQFERRYEIAKDMEEKFMQRHFGTNEEVVEFARKLVLAGQRAAATALNSLVDVVGSGVDPRRLIEKIYKQFDVGIAAEVLRADSERMETIRRLKQRTLDSTDFDFPRSLATHLDYRVEEIGNGIFLSPRIVITTPTGKQMEFPNRASFVRWAQQNLCS